MNRKKLIKLFFLILVFFFICTNFVYAKYYSKYISKYSQLFGLEESLVYSIIKNESRFNKKAISKKGAMGLMQVMDTTGEEIFNKLNVHEKYRDLSQAEANIMVGTYYISDLISRYQGDIDKAIAAYNAGPSNVDKWDKSYGDDFSKKIEFPETRIYLKKVKRDYKIYKFLYETLHLGWMNLPDIFVGIKVFFYRIIRLAKGLFD